MRDNIIKRVIRNVICLVLFVAIIMTGKQVVIAAEPVELQNPTKDISCDNSTIYTATFYVNTELIFSSSYGSSTPVTSYIYKDSECTELISEEQWCDEWDNQKFMITLEAGTYYFATKDSAGNITEEQMGQLERLQNKYQLNIQEISSSILSKKDSLVREIRNEKLTKLKASVTVGIEQQKKMASIMGRIGPEKRRNAPPKRLMYGNTWYIAIDENGYIMESKYDAERDAEGEERKMFEETLLSEKRNPNVQVNSSDLRRCTKRVTATQKQKAINRIK